MKIVNPESGYAAVEKAVFGKGDFYGSESILVRIGTKGLGDKEFCYSTELLINDGEDWANPYYIWESDWWEGQHEIEVVWAAPVSAFESSPGKKFEM